MIKKRTQLFDRSTYRIANEKLQPRSAGSGPLKLLYPKSNTSNSFNPPIPPGMIPVKELLRKILKKNFTLAGFTRESSKKFTINHYRLKQRYKNAYIDFMWTSFPSSGDNVPPRQRSFKFLHIILHLTLESVGQNQQIEITY